MCRARGIGLTLINQAQVSLEVWRSDSKSVAKEAISKWPRRGVGTLSPKIKDKWDELKHLTFNSVLLSRA